MNKQVRKSLRKAMKKVVAGKLAPDAAGALSALADSASRSKQVQNDSKRR